MNLTPSQMKMGLDQIDDHIRNIKAGGPMKKLFKQFEKTLNLEVYIKPEALDPGMFRNGAGMF